MVFIKQWRGNKFGNRAKYNNIPSSYNGILFRSILERNYAMWLDSEKRKDKIKKWRYEAVKFKLHAKGGGLITTYTPDFEITFPDGHIEFHETKGKETEVWRLKWKHCRLEYPNKKFIIVR